MPAMADMTLWVRENPIDQAKDVKNTFSSWDTCMQKDYCKWPVIVAIVIGALILISIISCLVRCLCCGLDCCFGCFKCCNACCDCCQPRKSRDRYRAESPAFNSHNPYGGYQPPPAAPTYIIQQPAPAPVPSRYEPTRQYASYDSPAKRSVPMHEDALPAQPTWRDAHAYHEEEVEMDHLNHHPGQQAPMLAGAAAAGAVGAAGAHRGGPTPSTQAEGQGLYADEPTHHVEGDLGDPYSHPGAPVGAAVAGGAIHPAFRDQVHNDYQEHYQDTHYPQQGGYQSPPAHDPYGAPHGAANNYYDPAPSAGPPSYHTGPPSTMAHEMRSPVSPTSTALGGTGGGLPSALTPGGGIQPAHQASGQDTGVTGGQQYQSYSGAHHQQSYRDV